MAETNVDLGDFFAKKAKKKIKGTNLNTAITSKPEAKKAATKNAEEDGWEEEQVVASTMKVEVAGKLTREEDKKDEEDTEKAVWGNKAKNQGGGANINEKKFPSLASSVMYSSNINIDDGSSGKVNIETSKNAFSALEGGDGSDDEVTKRPTKIQPAMVTKKKGERETVAVKREVAKYGGGKGDSKEMAKDDDESEEENSDEEKEKAKASEVKTKKKDKRQEEPKAAPEPVEDKDTEADTKIAPDLAASKAKYSGRKKLPPVELPASELEEEKENRPKAKAKAGGKKKVFAAFEEDDKKRMIVVEE